MCAYACCWPPDCMTNRGGADNEIEMGRLSAFVRDPLAPTG